MKGGGMQPVESRVMMTHSGLAVGTGLPKTLRGRPHRRPTEAASGEGVGGNMSL